MPRGLMAELEYFEQDQRPLVQKLGARGTRVVESRGTKNKEQPQHQGQGGERGKISRSESVVFVEGRTSNRIHLGQHHKKQGEGKERSRREKRR